MKQVLLDQVDTLVEIRVFGFDPHKFEAPSTVTPLPPSTRPIFLLAAT